MWQHQADIQLEARLDVNDYNEATLIELKVPLNLPYQTDWKDFERYDGEIIINGQYYKYVKRKVQDGMLVVKCIPNEIKHQIESARDYFFQLANDFQKNDGPKKSDSSKHSLTKNNITEYEEYAVFAFSAISSASRNQKTNCNNNCIVTRSISSPEQPPEV